MARRPLPPLDARKARRLRWIALGYAGLGLLNAAAAVVDFTWWRAVTAVFFFGAALAWMYEIRRRSDPARTAGWGRPG